MTDEKKAKYEEGQRIAAEVAAHEVKPSMYCDDCKARALAAGCLAYEICDECSARCFGARKAGAS